MMNFILHILIIFSEIRAFFLRKVFLRNIGPNDLVLDIGSGDKPLWRADVLVDLYPEDDQQRFSGSMLYDKKKTFINANVEHLPFKDKSFDFIFCSHLLEHVDRPDRAIKEITRVGKRGYIEVPRTVLDALDPFPPHLWFCELDRDTLIFHQKEKRQNFFLASLKRFGDSYFHTLLMQYLFIKDFRISFICHYWKDKVKFKIEKAQGKPYRYIYHPEKKHFKSSAVSASFMFYKLIYIMMNTFFYRPKHIDMEKLLNRNG